MSDIEPGLLHGSENRLRRRGSGCKEFNKLRKEGEQHGIEKVGKRLRDRMPWIKKRDLKGAQASYS